MKIKIVDFKNSARTGFFEQIYDFVKDLDISILVNNVSIDHFDSSFFNQTDEQIYEILHINLYPMVFLTKKMI